MRFLHRTHISGQFLRYLANGTLCLLVDYLFLIILAEYLHFYYLLAAAISFALSETVSFFISIGWVFVVKNHIGKGTLYLLFQAAGGIGLILTIFGIWFLTGVPWLNRFGLALNQSFGLQLPLYLIPKTATTIVVFFWHFCSKKWLLSKRPERYLKYFVKAEASATTNPDD